VVTHSRTVLHRGYCEFTLLAWYVNITWPFLGTFATRNAISAAAETARTGGWQFGLREHLSSDFGCQEFE
jgi:hypothetical protein